MADDETTVEPAEPVEPAERDAPMPTTPRSAAAAAASRARRIGGRVPTTGQGAAPKDAPAGPADSDAAAPAPVPRATKPATDDPTVMVVPTTEPAVITVVPSWLRWMPAAVLIAGALTMTVLLATFSHSVWWAKPTVRHTSVNVIRDQVLAAAKACTVAANQYSYTSFARDKAKGAKCLTGAQVTKYNAAMTAIAADVARLKASQVPQINDAGIESITPDGKQWAIVVYGQLSITQTGTGTNPRIDPFAAYVRMDYVHGKWLMSSLCTIGGTGQC